MRMTANTLERLAAYRYSADLLLTGSDSTARKSWPASGSEMNKYMWERTMGFRRDSGSELVLN